MDLEYTLNIIGCVIATALITPGCIIAGSIIITSSSLAHVIKFPFRKHDKYRLKKVFNRWVSQLSTEDISIIERYIKIQLVIKNLNKLLSRPPCRNIEDKIDKWIQWIRHENYFKEGNGIVESTSIIPLFLLTDVRIPNNTIIIQKLDYMLLKIKRYYQDNPTGNGFVQIRPWLNL
jgi:hypothetical protein